jgi:hypothetical protein
VKRKWEPQYLTVSKSLARKKHMITSGDETYRYHRQLPLGVLPAVHDGDVPSASLPCSCPVVWVRQRPTLRVASLRDPDLQALPYGHHAAPYSSLSCW